MRLGLPVVTVEPVVLVRVVLSGPARPRADAPEAAYRGRERRPRMDSAAKWRLGAVGGMALFGAAAGASGLHAPLEADPLAFATALFFASAFISSFLGAQLYRRGIPGAVLVGAASGAAGVLAFVVVLFESFPTVLLAMPLLAAGISAIGTAVLSNGVRRYRERHGTIHAPR
jgi:hypothetical protein